MHTHKTTGIIGNPRLAMLAACLALAAGGAPALAQGGSDVRVNQDPPGLVQNETSLTLNPAMPGNVVMAFNDNPYAGTMGLGIAFSTDWGMTWTHQRLPVPPGMVDAFDPVTAADNRGFIYAGHISTDGVAGGQSGFFLRASTDGGMTWPWATTVNGSLTNLLDKPHIATDTQPGSPYMNALYATWIRDFATTGPFSDIYFSHAIILPPIGFTFFVAMQISDMPPGVGRGCGPNIAVAADGTVYVVWLDTDVTGSGMQLGTLFLDGSTDGGLNFGADTFVRQILTVNDPLFPGGPIARSFPCLETSPTNPLELYLVYACNPAGAPWIDAVMFQRSMDGGNTWSAPTNLSPVPGGAHFFEPWIAVKPNGTIDVAWYECHGMPPGPYWWDVMITRSRDGGNTWALPVPVSDVPFLTPVNPAGTPWMGEYLGLVVDQTDAYIGFTSSVSDPLGDVYFDRIENMMIPLPCPADVNGDGTVDVLDLLAVLAAWGSPGGPEDINGDGIVDVLDLLAVIAAWGPCP